MALLRWIRSGGERPTPAPPARPTPPPSAHPLAGPPAAAEEIGLAEAELRAAWRPSSKRLVVAAPRTLPRGARVVVAVRSEGGAVIPIGGAVAETSGTAALEVTVDADRLPAVERLLASLEGRALRPRSRPPRYRISLPAVVTSASVHAYMTTFSLSQGGCGLVWSGPTPPRGALLQVRLGSGSRSAAFKGRVAWTSENGGAVKVGVRFAVGDDAALAALLAQARRDSTT